MCPKREPERRILQVADVSRSGWMRVSESLRTAGIEIELCPDVYRAWARLVRFGGQRYDAVVVFLDGLPESEYEFFRLVRRRIDGIPVFVHGEECSSELIEQARSLGATGVLDEALVALGPLLGRGVTEDEAVGDELTGETSREPVRSDRSTAVRVPWVADPQRPTRQRPEPSATGQRNDRKPLSDTSASLGEADRSEGTGVGEAPLLTQEEIEMLMGDESDAAKGAGRPEEGLI